MFKAIGLSGIGFSKAVVALAAAATLAAGSLGFVGNAEARINGDPASPMADLCKGFQDGYDRWVANFYQAETPEELLEARSWVNLYMEAWHNSGCEAYGDIRFIVAGGASNVAGVTKNNLTLTVNATPTPSLGSLKVAGATLTSSRAR